jgi:hypothetical protein
MDGEMELVHWHDEVRQRNDGLVPAPQLAAA